MLPPPITSPTPTPMATTAQHIAARDDADLIARLVAAAEMADITDADQRVRSNLGSLIAVVVQDGQTVADVHAYAADVRRQYLAADQALPPGQNPGAVTDAHLATAVAMLIATSQTAS